MAAGSIVEDLDVVEDVGACEFARLVDSFADALLLEAAEEGFGNRVDAPMSSRVYRFCQIRQDQRVQLANNVTLEATLNLLRGQSLGSPASDVRTGPRIAPHTNHRDRP